MGSFSIWHWLIVLVVVLLLFGRGKIPELMGDFAKGIKSFKKGMQDEDKEADASVTPPAAASAGAPQSGRTIDNLTGKPVPATEEKSRAG